MISRYQIVKNKENDDYTLVVYLDQELTEFSAELGTKPEKRHEFNHYIQSLVKSKLNGFKVTTIKVMAGTVLISSLSMTGINNTAYASDSTDNQTQSGMEFDLYTVKAGDSLFKIAREFSTSVNDLREVNNLHSDLIFPGQILQLPFSTYTVLAGDNLFRIAQRYNVTVDQLMSYNNLTSNTIFIGQELRVPLIKKAEKPTEPDTPEPELNPVPPSNSDTAQTPDPEPVDPEIVPEPDPEPIDTTTTYTVIRGDTLWSIANRHKTTVGEIRTLNNMTTDAIFIGQQLTIPSQDNTPPPLEEPVAPDPDPVPEPTTPEVIPATPTFSDLEPITQTNQDSYLISGEADPDTNIRVTVRDAENNVLKELDLNTDNDGRFSSSLDLTEMNDGELTITTSAMSKTGHSSNETTTTIVKTTFVDIPVVEDFPSFINKQTVSDFHLLGTGKSNNVVLATVTDTNGTERTFETSVQDDGHYIFSMDLSDFIDSVLDFNIIQKDAFGNQSDAKTLQVEKDTVAPDAPVLEQDFYINEGNQKAVLFNGIAESYTSIFLTISDSEGNEKTLNGTTGDDGKFTLTGDLTSFEDGVIYLTVFQMDKAENKSPASHVELTKNTEIPEITVNEVATIFSGNVSEYMLGGSASPNSEVHITVSDGENNLNGTATAGSDGQFEKVMDLSSLADGEITIQFFGKNPFGNQSSGEEFSVVKDTNAPEGITLQTADFVNRENQREFIINGETSEREVYVEISITDGVTDITQSFFVDDDAFSVDFDLSDLNDGPLTLEMIQKDKAGNVSEAESVDIEKVTELGEPTVIRSGYTFVGDQLMFNIVGSADPLSTLTVTIVNDNGEMLREFHYSINERGSFNFDINVTALAAEHQLTFLVNKTDHAGNFTEVFTPETVSYTVVSGDTLSQIARKYNTTITAIQSINNIGETIHPGQRLNLPVTASQTLSLGYMYFGAPSSFTNQVIQTQHSFNTVSPSYFDLNSDGSLKLTHLVDATFISNMQKQGVRVVPFLSNHWDRAVGRAMLENMDSVTTEIANAVTMYNLDGVNVDIENINHEDREAFTEFVRLLREKLPSSKEVSVAVAANPNNWQVGWHGAYDYYELAKYTDYLMIMTYDESYQGGQPGPVAGLPWVERSIQYAIAEGVPKDKIVIGLAHYGRYWMEGAPTGGNGISNFQIERMLELYEHTIEFDEVSQSPKATITIKEGDPHTVIMGSPLPPGTYTVWFENDQSYQAKTELVQKYGIRGVGHWSIGQENRTVWESYPVWLAGKDSISNGGAGSGATDTDVGEEAGSSAPEIPSDGESGESLDSEVELQEHKVVSGDTLYRISLRYGVTVNAIKEANNLSGDMIYVGQVLKIPAK